MMFKGLKTQVKISYIFVYHNSVVAKKERKITFF